MCPKIDPKQNLQHHLNLGLRDCEQSGDTIRPCGYHEGRARTTPFGFPALSGISGFTAFLAADDPTREAAALFCSGIHPAGGWYLVHEQRDWLARRLSSLFRGFDQPRPLRVLEAGVAGFVHHYTYLSIIHEALRFSPAPEVRVCVTDKCTYPIQQIRAAEGLRGAPSSIPPHMTIGGHRLPIHGPLRNILERKPPGLTTELHTTDLRAEELERLGPFDVVTEHFLTSVLDADFDVVEKIWSRYAAAMSPGGSFLCAVGTVAGTEPMRRYLDIAERLGFALVEQDTEHAWDPYGLNRQELLHLLGRGAAGIGIALDNSLLHFSRAAR